MSTVFSRDTTLSLPPAWPDSEPYLAGSAALTALGLTAMWFFAGATNHLAATALTPFLAIGAVVLVATIRKERPARRELFVLLCVLVAVGIFAISPLISYAWWPVPLAYLLTAIWSRNLGVLAVGAASSIGLFAMWGATSIVLQGPGLTIQYLGPIFGLVGLLVARALVRRAPLNPSAEPIH